MVADSFDMFEDATHFEWAHVPVGFYTRAGIQLDIDLEQGTKDLINTFDHLTLALNLAHNIGKLAEAKQYIEKAILDGFLFGKIGDDEAYRTHALTVIQSL